MTRRLLNRAISRWVSGVLTFLLIALPAATAAQTTDPASLVPAAMRQAGVLRVAGDASFPPFYYLDADSQYRGFDIDVTTNIASILKLKPEYTNIATDGLIAGLQAHRFDIGVSALIDTPVREKILDFVEYYRAFSSLLVRKGNPDGITPTTICGKPVAVGKGTAAAVTELPYLSNQCVTGGKPEIKAMVYPTYPAGVLAISDGRVPAGLTLLPINRWIEDHSNGGLVDGGVLPGSLMIGLGVPKGEDQFEQALVAAVDQLIQNGTYRKLLMKWNILQQPLEKSSINHPTAPT